MPRHRIERAIHQPNSYPGHLFLHSGCSHWHDITTTTRAMAGAAVLGECRPSEVTHAGSADLRLLQVCGSSHVPARKAADLGKHEVCARCPAAKLWSAAACCRLLPGQLAGRGRRGNGDDCEQARPGKRQPVSRRAALQSFAVGSVTGNPPLGAEPPPHARGSRSGNNPAPPRHATSPPGPINAAKPFAPSKVTSFP